MFRSLLQGRRATNLGLSLGRRARVTRLGVFLLACGSLGLGSARALTINSTVLEDNGVTSNGLDGNQNVYSAPVAGPGILTTTGGYNFTATSFAALTSITSITVTLTMQDGNSEAAQPSGFDFNHLRLALDGSDTGLILNGFRGNGLQDTFTFSGAPLNAAAILASLKADGKLVGTVTTDNPNDTVVSTGPGTGPNEIYFGNDANNATTALSIIGVPEPGTWAGVSLGALLLAGRLSWRGRRSSRA